MKKFSLILIILSLFVFSACQKDEISVQGSLKDKIIAKWQINDFPVASSVLKNNFSNPNTRQKLSNNNFIEFFDNNEYLMVLSGMALGGKYKIENDKIILENLNSSLIEISLNDDKLSFKISGDGISENITAQKVELVSSDARNKMLCKKWELIDFDFEGIESEYYNLEDLESIFMRISEYGTYLSEHKLKDGTSFYFAAFWNWHPTKKDYFEYTQNEQTDIKGLIAVKKLSEESLSLEEEHDEGYYIYKIPMELKAVK